MKTTFEVDRKTLTFRMKEMTLTQGPLEKDLMEYQFLIINNFPFSNKHISYQAQYEFLQRNINFNLYQFTNAPLGSTTLQL